MKNLTAQFLASIDAEVAVSAYFLDITYRSTQTTGRFTDADITLLKNGQTYTSLAFSIVSADFTASSEIDRVSIAIDNVDQSLASIFLNNDERGSLVKIYCAALDDHFKIIDEICLFGGYVESFEITPLQITISCVSPLYKALTASLNHISAICINEFKGDVCQYSGTDTTCNHTFADCQSKNNTTNFRGGVVYSKISTKTAGGEIT